MKGPDLSGSFNESFAYAGDFDGTAQQPGTTGRYLVLFREGAAQDAAALLKDANGITTANAADFNGSGFDEESVDADAIVFEELGVALVGVEPERAPLTLAGADTPIMEVEPER